MSSFVWGFFLVFYYMYFSCIFKNLLKMKYLEILIFLKNGLSEI